MKKQIAYSSLVGFFLAAFTFSTSMLRAGEQTNAVYLQIVQAGATNNIKAVIAALPAIEKLWPKEPEAYFKCMQSAARFVTAALAVRFVESASQTYPEGWEEALMVILTNTLQKPIPSDMQIALSCVDPKVEATLACMFLLEKKSPKDPLIKLAGFIGELRGRIIKNYVNRTEQIPVKAEKILIDAGVPDAKSLTDPASKKAYDKIMQENRTNMVMDQLQFQLSNPEPFLTSFLLQFCARFPANDPKNAAFIKEIKSLAKLSDAELKELKWK